MKYTSKKTKNTNFAATKEKKSPNLPQAHCRLIPKSVPKLEAQGLLFCPHSQHAAARSLQPFPTPFFRLATKLQSVSARMFNRVKARASMFNGV